MSNELIYSAIAQRYGFSLPAEYRQLESRGLLSLSGPAHASAFTAPGTYLWLNDMEWYPLHKIANFEFEPYCLPGFVPFAFTGAGDFWCWQPEFTDSNGTRVVCCYRDSYDARIYAPNFSLALYRQILDFCVSQPADDDEIDVRAFLRRWVVDLAPIFPSRWQEQLQELAHRLEFPVLSELEQKDIEKRDLPFDVIDTDVRWMQPIS